MEEKIYEWKKKEGESWYVLSINSLNRLTLDQSLKVQEMKDNKTHHHLQEKSNFLQEKFNRLIVVLTTFIVIGVFAEFIFKCYEQSGVPISSFFVGGFLISFLIVSIVFVIVSFSKP